MGYGYHDEDRDFYNPYHDQEAVHPPLQSYTSGQLKDQSQGAAYNNNYPPLQRTPTRQSRPRSGFEEGEFSQGAIAPDIQ